MFGEKECIIKRTNMFSLARFSWNTVKYHETDTIIYKCFVLGAEGMVQQFRVPPSLTKA